MMFLLFLKRLIPFLLLAGILLLLVYHFLVRPWIFRIGSTEDEITRNMPGDGKVILPKTKYTQSITINAPKDIVYAYITQLGCSRGGWYNLDFINRMTSKEYFYENNKSADRIIPELQDLKVGDKISVTPELSFVVEELNRNGHLLMAAKEGEKYLITWVYEIEEIDKNTTRLRVRWISNLGDSLFLKIINYCIIDPCGFGVQQRLNIKGIKSRSEATYAIMQKNSK